MPESWIGLIALSIFIFWAVILILGGIAMIWMVFAEFISEVRQSIGEVCQMLRPSHLRQQWRLGKEMAELDLRARAAKKELNLLQRQENKRLKEFKKQKAKQTNP